MTYSLTGNTVSSTYGRLVQVINNDEYYDGFGNPLNIGAGIQGNTGPQGETGPQGFTGNQGITGPQGYTGSQGETGPQGIVVSMVQTIVQWKYKGINPLGNDAGYFASSEPSFYDNTEFQIHFNDVNNNDYQYWFADLETFVRNGNPSYLQIYSTLTQSYTGLYKVNDVQRGTFTYSIIVGTPSVVSNGIFNVDETYNITWVANGSIGSQGETGVQGNTGLQGVTGPQGFTGPQGESGPQGNTGVQGFTGPQGFDGNQGFTGPQGLTGLQGSTGPQGGTGADGIVVTAVQSLVEWKYLSGGSLGSATQSFVSNNNSISSVTDLNFSKYNYNGVDYSGWFNELNTFVTSGFSTYLQLFQVGTPSNIGLFKVGTVSSGVDAFTVSFTNIIVSNGTLVDSSLYSFTWVANGKEGPQGPTGFGTGGGTISSISFFYQSESPTASSLTAGSRWFHSDTGVEYVYINDGDSTQWVQPTSTIAGSLNHYTLGVTTDTYNITLSSQYGPEYFGVSSSVTSYVYLPTNVSLGKSITVKDESGSASINNIYIFAYSGETIDNSTQSLISTDYGSKTLLRRNNNWWLI
jgi:hypothetical protein